MLFPPLIIALAMQPDPAMLRRLFEDNLARAERQYGATDAHTAQAARDLGGFLARQGDAGGAHDALARALQIDEATIGAEAPQTLADAAELAGVSPPAQAEPLWQRAAGAKDQAVAARALTALGSMRAAAGDRTGAAGFYRRALEQEEAASGSNSEAVAVRLNALASVLEAKEAVPLLQRALAIDRRALGARHPEAASTEANLAARLLSIRRFDEAARAATNALMIFRETLGADHPRCAIAADIAGYSLAGKGDRAGAAKMFRLALAVDERAFGPNAPQTMGDRRALAELGAGAH